MAVVPAHLRATTTGIAEVCWTGANAVGPMVAGLLSDTLGDPNKSAEEGDHSGLVTMLLIGATIPLGHAAIAWHWRGSVADEIATQQQVRSATSPSMPHDVHEEVRLPVVARMFVLLPCVIETTGFRLCLIAVSLKIVGASRLRRTPALLTTRRPSIAACRRRRARS